MEIILYLTILLIGGFIGSKNLLKKSIVKNLDRIQTLAILLLLFIMGISIGMDKEVIGSFHSIGLQALVITIFSIGFSILFVRLVSKKIVIKEEERAGNDY